MFPLPFSGTRWIEDKKVADRAIQIWPNIIKYINETLKKPKSQVPTSSYFAKIRSAVQDSLIVAKLQFFASTASLMVPYLQKFQTDTPLIALTTTEITVLLETLMQKFIKQSEMQAANTVVKIAKLNVIDTTIHMAPSDVDIGFAATDTLTKAVNEKKLSSQQVFEFKKECCTMLAAIVSKIQERSPLKYSFARNLVSLDPRLIAAEPDKVVRMFREVLTKLVDKKWRTPEQADDIWMQYKKLVTEVKQFHKDKFSGFKFGEDRLDTFFFEVLDQKIAYKGLWCTVQLLLTLSHGQAAVERGFSVNKDILAPNLKTLSLTSIHLIHDTISTKEINIADYIITDELRKSCSHASNRYKMYMMERQTKDQEPEKVRKRKALQDDLVSAKKRKTELQVTAQKLVHSADEKAKDAVKRTDAAALRALLIESNAS